MAWAVKSRASNEVQNRREHIIARRQENWTFKRIGEELGITGTQVQRLYKLGLLDRLKREAKAAQDAATPESPLGRLGFHPDLVHALSGMRLRTVGEVMAMDRKEFTAAALRYHNVRKRILSPLFEICDRLTEG